MLAVATTAVQLGPWRYQPLPGVPVALDDYRVSGTPWFTSRRGATIDRDGETPGIALAGGQGLAYAARWIRPVAGASHTRVALDFALDDVSENTRGIGASIAVVSFGRKGERLAHWPRELFNGSGTQSWDSAELVIPWSDDVALMRLELVLAGESGRMTVRRIAIASLVDAPWYPWVHRGLVAAWCLLGVATVTAAIRHGRPRHAALAATAAAAFIAIGGIVPEPLFEQLAAPVEQPLVSMGQALIGTAPTATATPRPQSERETQAPSLPPTGGDKGAGDKATPASTPPPPDLLDLSREAAMWARRAVSHNVIHATGFGGLALLVAFVAPPVGIVHAAGLAGFAAVTETLQMLTVTRGANLEDIAVDCLSAFAGLALGIAIRLALARRRASTQR